MLAALASPAAWHVLGFVHMPPASPSIVTPGSTITACRRISARYRANSPTDRCSLVGVRFLVSAAIAQPPFPLRRMHLPVRHSGIWI